jgi:hypothetical protein
VSGQTEPAEVGRRSVKLLDGDTAGWRFDPQRFRGFIEERLEGGVEERERRTGVEEKRVFPSLPFEREEQNVAPGKDFKLFEDGLGSSCLVRLSFYSRGGEDEEGGG